MHFSQKHYKKFKFNFYQIVRSKCSTTNGRKYVLRSAWIAKCRGSMLYDDFRYIRRHWLVLLLRRIRRNAMWLKFCSWSRSGFDRGVVDTIPMAFSLFMVGQTESFVLVGARTSRFWSSATEANRGRIRILRTYFLAGWLEAIFLTPCLFIAGFNVTRVISDYIFIREREKERESSEKDSTYHFQARLDDRRCYIKIPSIIIFFLRLS